MTVEFRFDQLDDEISAFAECASPFLAQESEAVLQAWREQLRNIQTASDGAMCSWQIRPAQPVWTILSEPRHNARDPHLRGRLTMKWELTIPRGVKRTRGRRADRFVLAGIASTKMSLFKNDSQAHNEVARWCFEIGDANSPGCHFHTQVKGDPGSQLFPPTLSVPRLPGWAVTPIDAMDFLLGELFQDTWVQRVGEETDSVRTWANIHHARLTKLLRWQQQELSSGTGAGWSRLKRAKPESDLFIAH
jgi:hypothetical protein